MGSRKRKDTGEKERAAAKMCKFTYSMIRLVVGSLCIFQVLSLSVNVPRTNVVAGATGYIGRAVVQESIRQGYKTIALVRDKSKVESEEGKALFGKCFAGAEVVECDVSDTAQLSTVRE